MGKPPDEMKDSFAKLNQDTDSALAWALAFNEHYPIKYKGEFIPENGLKKILDASPQTETKRIDE